MRGPAPAGKASLDPLRGRGDGADVPDRFVGISLIASSAPGAARVSTPMIDPVGSSPLSQVVPLRRTPLPLLRALGWSEESLSFRAPGRPAAGRPSPVVRSGGQRQAGA
jgi:hypothetical protein